MSIAEKVRMNVRRMKPGTVFMVSDLPTYKEEKRATVKAISYYSSSDSLKEKYGSVNKIADGLYYKEEEGFLGKLPPSYDAVLHALTFVKNKKVGFVTGHQLFNKKGLSTQVPAIITVVTSKYAPTKINISGIKIEVIRKEAKINENDIKRYEFEYILNNFEKIQAVELDGFHESLKDYIELINNDHRQFEKLYSHLQYKKTKAILGALIDNYQEKTNENFEPLLNEIKKDLNVRSKYKVGRLSHYISNGKEWNIEF